MTHKPSPGNTSAAGFRMQLSRSGHYRMTLPYETLGAPHTFRSGVCPRCAAALRLLSSASKILASSLDYVRNLRAMAGLIVAEFAEYCVIEVYNDEGIDTLAIAAHGETKRGCRLRLPSGRPRAVPGRPVLVRSIDAVLLEQGITSMLVAPLVARGAVLGAITFLSSGKGRQLTLRDTTFAEELALRAAVAVDSAHLYVRERHAADTLQRALLPQRLPQAPGLAYHAAYLPGAKDSVIGGDWYDAFPLPDGKIAFSIGDVAGHGLPAAIVMGEVRQTFRAAALSAESPAMVLHRANAILNLREPSVMVTAIFGVFDPSSSTATYATAGHPPPILANVDGLVQVLPSCGIPLGISEAVHSIDFTFTLAPGSLLVLYTDGLIEHARDPIAGEAALVEAVALEAAVLSEDPARSIARRIFRGEVGNTDDVATLTLTLADHPWRHKSFAFSAIPLAAKIARHSLRRLARELGLSTEKAFAFVAAAGEAVANAVEHAYSCEQPGILLINVHRGENSVLVEIEDRGCWKKSPKREERGRGLPLMRALADSVQIHSNRSGTVVKLLLSL